MRRGLSRRAVLGAGLAAVAAGVAGCATALRSDPSPTAGPSAATASDATTSEPGMTERGSTSATPPPTSAPRTAPSTGLTSRTAKPTASSASSVSSHSKAAAPTAIRVRGPADQIDTGPAAGSQLALTFHGAGDIGLARQILQIAADKKAHITVMVVGTWLEQNPAIASAILAAGHELGNHTWSHQNINALPEEKMRQEVIRCRDALVTHAGTPGTYFRQSQSQIANEQLRTVAGEAGYRFCLSYDVDSMDWTDPGGAAVRANLGAARAGSIVSMHLGHQSSVDALPGILDDLAARGLRPVTVSALFRA